MVHCIPKFLLTVYVMIIMQILASQRYFNFFNFNFISFPLILIGLSQPKDIEQVKNTLNLLGVLRNTGKSSKLPVA
jgi:hypothetical protein